MQIFALFRNITLIRIEAKALTPISPQVNFRLSFLPVTVDGLPFMAQQARQSGGGKETLFFAPKTLACWNTRKSLDSGY